MHNFRERLCVEFSSKIGTADNCICNACHHIGYVIKLEVPETTYNNGGKLKTKYRPFWLCRNCRDKLVKALEWEVAEDGN
jgi:hypothetical protein